MRGYLGKPGIRKDNLSWSAMAIVFGVGLADSVNHAAIAEPSGIVLDCTKFEKPEPDSGVIVKGVGPFRFATGPELTKTAESWDHVVYGITERYRSLCGKLSIGLITKAEYETIMKDIDRFYREAKDLEERLLDTVRHRRAGDRSTGTNLEPAVGDLAARMRQGQGLEQISAPLKLGSPKKPRPILGAPGRTEEPESPLSR